jgi:hypothetical protein
MGNQNSTNKQNNEELKPKSISQILDYIATHYILTLDFKSLRKLYNKDYCDKLVILTSDIIERYFTDMEITYLAQRVKNGVEVNELDKDNIIFFDRNLLNKLDIQNSIKKKRICIGIAKFYIKIAHVFAAIVTTINPVYVYKDAEGNTVKASLYEKGSIPPNTPRQIYKMNICENRINALKNGHDMTKGEITVGPDVCGLNIGDNNEIKDLENEPGIPELMELYYDDKYDYETGKFTGMSKETNEVFLKDLQIFRSVFTGNSESLPENITKFSDIKLRDYHKMEECQGDNPKFETNVTGPLSNSLFAAYANNLKKMIIKANQNQQSLLSIINKIFKYTIDPQSNKKQIRIDSELTEKGLDELIIEVRGMIIKLYLTCEMDYVEGLKLYQAILDTKIFETTQRQMKNLNKELEQLVIEETVPEPAEFNELKENAEKNKEERKEEQKEEQKEDQNVEQLVNEIIKPEVVIKDLNDNQISKTQKSKSDNLENNNIKQEKNNNPNILPSNSVNEITAI